MSVETPEERVALLVEALDERVVGHAGEQMRRDLRFLVVSELDPERSGETRRLAPDRWAACPGRVEVRDIDGATDDEVPDPDEGGLALPGTDRDGRLVPDVAHPAGVIRPAARLLEPADVEVPHELGEFHGLCPVVALVGVDHEDEVRTRRGPGGADASGILGRGATAHLELHAGEAGLDVAVDDLRHLVDRQVVVAADDADRNGVAGAPPDAMEGQADGPPEDVPDGLVDTGDRLQRQASIAQDVVRGGLHGQPRTLGIGGRPSEQARRQLVMDDRDDDRLLDVRVARVHLGHQAVVGVQPGHDRAPVVHAVGAAREPSPEWRPQRQRSRSGRR